MTSDGIRTAAAINESTTNSVKNLCILQLLSTLFFLFIFIKFFLQFIFFGRQCVQLNGKLEFFLKDFVVLAFQAQFFVEDCVIGCLEGYLFVQDFIVFSFYGVFFALGEV